MLLFSVLVPIKKRCNVLRLQRRTPSAERVDCRTLASFASSNCGGGSLILNALVYLPLPPPPPSLLPFLLFSPRHQYAGARGGGSAPRGARAGWGSGCQGGARGQGVGARAEGFQRGVGHGPAPRGSVAGDGGGQVRRTGAARDAVMWYRLASYFCCGKYCCVGFRAGGLRSPVQFFLAPDQGMQSAVSAGCWFLVTTTNVPPARRSRQRPSFEP